MSRVEQETERLLNEPCFDRVEAQPGNVDYLLPRRLAAQHRHRAARKIQRFREKFAEDLVRAAFDRWRVELYLERATEPADDFIARGIRNRFDHESAR